MFSNSVYIQWGYVAKSQVKGLSEQAFTITLPTSMRDSLYSVGIAQESGAYFASIVYGINRKTETGLDIYRYNNANSTSASIGIYWHIVG